MISINKKQECGITIADTPFYVQGQAPYCQYPVNDKPLKA